MIVSRSDRADIEVASVGEDKSMVYNNNAPTSVCVICPKALNNDSKLIDSTDGCSLLIGCGCRKREFSSLDWLFAAFESQRLSLSEASFALNGF